ncbi:erythromycin esterase family protein [Nocardiopsis trehalosi]|uniref:erythromycin esterase family protein n=1 Tax=Nocardiopsis trehalosi TaxID=109329 RepID=UPI000A05DBF2|nr:erythromycin esterase family protein [Nocardiopsis trehalosi]
MSDDRPRPAAPDAGPAATGRLRPHTAPLDHVDPDAPLDDLAALDGVIGDARVVAIGENSHFITEFGKLRERLLRHLVERRGFTLLTFEYGFSEGVPLDAWVHGEGGATDLAAATAARLPMGLDPLLHRLRRHNAAAEHPVAFGGVDVPEAGGSLRPALDPVAAYLRDVDPEALPLVDTALRVAASFSGRSQASAAPRWERTPAAEQDALSAVLSRLLLRLRAVEPLYVERGGRAAFDLALRRVEGAVATEYTFRAMAGLFAGTGMTADTSARDRYMADSLLWHLRRRPPGTRAVVMAHNAHIQRTPVSFDGQLTGLPMGLFLDEALGADYAPLALTGIGGRTAEMVRVETAEFGFVVEDTELGAPEAGSVEAELAGAGGNARPVLADLRAARRAGLAPEQVPDRLRMQAGYLHTPVAEAFDGVLAVPATTVLPDLDL